MLPGVGTIGRLLGLAAFPVGLMAILESGKVRKPRLPLVLMCAFVLWGSLTYWWTIEAENTIRLTISWLQNLGMVWLMSELADSKPKVLLLMQAFVLGTLVSAGDTLSSYVRGEAVNYQRYAASGFDPNDLGLLLALSLPLSFYLATIRRQSRMVWVYRFQQVAAVFAIGLASSRAALIATAVAVTYIPLASVAMTLRQKCAFLLLIVIACGCILAFLPETTWQRWASLGQELGQGNWSSRKVIWSVGWDIFESRPVLGVGAGCFRTAAQQWLPPIGAHNTYLSILVEEGLVGFAIFLLMLLSLALSALQLPHLERALWLVVMATWAVGVFSLTWENGKPTWFLLGLIAAWCGTRTLSQRAPQSRIAFAPAY